MTDEDRRAYWNTCIERLTKSFEDVRTAVANAQLLGPSFPDEVVPLLRQVEGVAFWASHFKREDELKYQFREPTYADRKLMRRVADRRLQIRRVLTSARQLVTDVLLEKKSLKLHLRLDELAKI